MSQGQALSHHGLRGVGLGEEGPPLEAFLPMDTSFLSQIQVLDPDDEVAYRVYSDVCKDVQGLSRMREALLKVVGSYTRDYLWHREPFSLAVVERTDNDEAHLTGRTLLGENIDDEWFITWLLQWVTGHPDLHEFGLSAYVVDSDGHFLLAEAADVLPDWLSPELSDYRLWLRGGRVHLVTLQHLQGQLTSASSALAVLRGAPTAGSGSTLAPGDIEAAIQERLSPYPSKIEADKHVACCVLPLSVAHILRQRPDLVAPAIRALRLREPSEFSSICGTMKRFTPRPPLVRTMVTFTKFLYGMLESEDVAPPKPFNAAVAETLARGGHEVMRHVQRGVKLACGMELLYQTSKRMAEKAVGYGERAFRAYVKRLEAKGLFDGLLEGSASHKKRMEEARRAFETMHVQRAAEVAVSDAGVGSSVESVGSRVHETLDALTGQAYSVEDFPEAGLEPDDDDSWLDMSPEGLDALLTRYGTDVSMEGQEVHSGPHDEHDEDSGAEEDEEAEDLDRIVAGMRSFMAGVGGLEGAEIRKKDYSAGGSKPVSFDIERFMKILQRRSSDDESSDAEDESSMERSDHEDSDEDQQEGGASAQAPSQDGQIASLHPIPQMPSRKATVSREAKQGKRVRLLLEGHHGPLMEESLGADSDDEGARQDVREAEEPSIREVMDLMDRELYDSTLAASFELAAQGHSDQQAPAAPTADAVRAHEEPQAHEEPEYRPVDVDLNLVKNLLESYAHQTGGPGPVSNILGELAELTRDLKKRNV